MIGGGNSAAEESIFLTRFVEHVTLLVRGESLSASQILQEKVLGAAKIDVRNHIEAVAFRGEESKLKAVVVEDNRTGERSEMHPAGVFVFIGQQPNSGFLEGSGVRLDRWGFVVTGHALMHGDSAPIGYEGREPTFLESSLPGVFAAGDVRAGSTKQVVSAAGEGATAALLIREYLQHT